MKAHVCVNTMMENIVHLMTSMISRLLAHNYKSEKWFKNDKRHRIEKLENATVSIETAVVFQSMDQS